jgi:hypothetical protein
MNVFSAYLRYPEAKESHLVKAKGLWILVHIVTNLRHLILSSDNMNQLIQLVIDFQASSVGSNISKQSQEYLYSIFTVLCR